MNGDLRNSQMPAANPTELEIKKYLKILKKRKILIISIFLVVFIAWLGYVFAFKSRPVYTSTAILTFQDPRTMSAVNVTERGSINASKASLITSNLLLGQVVEKLQLNLSVVTENLTRSELFRYVEVNRESVPGYYKIVLTKPKLELYYTNEDLNISNSLIYSFNSTDTVRINKMTFVLNTPFLKKNNFKEVEFRIKGFELTIEQLRTLVSYQLDRSRTILKISAIHYSPEVAANIVNTISDLFIQLNLQMKRYKNDEVLKILENQLELAKIDLENANQRLREFREKNPWVVLTSDARAQITNINTYEENKYNLQSKVDELKKMLLKIDGSQGFDQQIVAARELLTYLENEGYPLAPAFESEYTELMDKRNTLLREYAPTHTFVIENQNALRALIQKIKNAANGYIQKLSSQINQVESSINLEKYKLRKLPQKSLILAELVRDQELKNSLYSSISSRYNQAKIEREVEVSDIFIVDRGTPPPPETIWAELIKKAFMGLFLALGLGVGVAIVVEFFNKTAESVEDLQEKLKIPVLGSIPIIKDDKEVPEDLEEIKGKHDPKLITLDYSPTLESESYRDLRTKVLFMNQNTELSSLIITSLRPGEGKSLTVANLAVTIAQQKIPTLLIDADLRRGVLHNIFANEKKPGLSDFLISNATVDLDNINKLVQNTFVPNLFMITSGSPIPNPSEMLGSARMVQLLKLVKSRFGMVILDTPPIDASSDSAVLAMYVDGVLLVVKAGETNVEHLIHRISQYPKLGEKILGAILNMVKLDVRKHSYKYSYYNY